MGVCVCLSTLSVSLSLCVSLSLDQVAHIKDYLPQACPHGDSMILDSEVLMVDLKTGNPLPFGTLGIHKVCEHMCNISIIIVLVHM